MELDTVKCIDGYKEWLLQKQEEETAKTPVQEKPEDKETSEIHIQENPKQQDDNKLLKKKYNDLLDKIILIQDDVKKIMIVIGDMQEDFFKRYDPTTKDGQIGISWEYVRYKEYAGIASDYVHKICEQLNQAMKNDYA